MAETKTKNEAKEEKRVNIRLPLDRNNPQEDSLLVGVNGKMYRIKRGETVSVPESVVEVLRHSEEMADRAYGYIVEASSKVE